MTAHDEGAPQHGAREPGRTYEDRPGAYAVVLDASGRVLCVRSKSTLHLPGGGLDAGETAEEALHREVREETGRAVDVVRPLGRASQYVVSKDGAAAWNKRGSFFLARLRPGPAAPAQHEPVWLTRVVAERDLKHDFYRWALRRAAGPGA